MSVSRPSRLLLIPVVLACSFFLLPVIGLVLRAPWSRFTDSICTPAVLDALILSVQCSVSAAAISCLFGLPLAVWLARDTGWIRTSVRVLVTLPMVLPPVVGGVAMLLVYGRNGFVGGVFDRIFGFGIPFSTLGVIAAETYVAMPFFVLTVESGLRALDPRYAEAAATLGARPWRVFRTVTLPLIAPAVGAGLLIAWARALGEFGATITFAGNLAGETRTLPLAVYVALETDPGVAIVLSLLLVFVSVLVLFVMRRRWFPVR